jgi:pyruvate kinase
MSSFSLTETWKTIAPAAARPTIRRTKIVCTLGPATNDAETIFELAAAGMDVARLNFSHGSHDEQLARLRRVRSAQERVGRPIAVLADLCGPKIRVAGLREPMQVATGDSLVLTEPERAQPGELGVTFAALLAQVVAPGDEVLIDDGRIRTRAEGSDGQRLFCRVEVGGTIKPSKGVNLPSSLMPIPALTEKDRADLEFALAAGADYVALSFVRTADDVAELRTLIDAAGSSARIIAKIEKAEAVVNLDAIIEASDAVMVARGDLGVEIGVSQVPLVQKHIIERARDAGRAVITATQMLESMIHESEPTRAEVSDVANAILDGTSAVMLSAETAAGDFPLRAVAQMDAIARSVEPSLVYERRIAAGADVAEILTHGACDLADDVGAPVIAVPTETGATARLVSRFRPQRPIVAAATSARVLQQLALEWAIVPLFVEEPPSVEAGWADIIARVLEHGLAQPGDTIVLTGRADIPLGGSTNHVFLHRVDEPEPKRRPRPADRSHAVQRHSRRLRARAAREAVTGG